LGPSILLFTGLKNWQTVFYLLVCDFTAPGKTELEVYWAFSVGEGISLDFLLFLLLDQL
jgi:hypothetical protein